MMPKKTTAVSCQKQLADHQSIDWWLVRFAHRQLYFDHASIPRHLATPQYRSGMLHVSTTFETNLASQTMHQKAGFEKVRIFKDLSRKNKGSIIYLKRF